MSKLIVGAADIKRRGPALREWRAPRPERLGAKLVAFICAVDNQHVAVRFRIFCVVMFKSPNGRARVVSLPPESGAGSVNYLAHTNL